MTESAMPPLAGVRVLEMCQLIAGPFCGQLFGDFGAEVIKLEQPKIGDPMRDWGQVKPQGQSLWWAVLGRNKKSVTLDARTPEGQEIVRRLVADADVLIENFRPGTMEKWGLGYDTLSAINPRLVMIRVSGFGQTGPRAREAGFGSIGEAMGGLRYVTGDADRPPARAGISIGDSLAATFAAIGGLLALRAREQTGRGQVVDSAIYEAVLAMMESLVSDYDQAGYVRERTGSVLPRIAPSNAYRCSDGMVLIAANQDTVFSRFAEAIGEAWIQEEAYQTHVGRGERQVELDQQIEAWTQTRTADEVIEIMNRHGVPVGRIYVAADMMDDPQFVARESIVRVAHPVFGSLAMQNVTPKLSATPGRVRTVGPNLGEHTDALLSQLLGFDAAKLADLRARGVI